jgi:oligopeptidase A
MRSAQVAAVLAALSFLSVLALALSMIHISKMVSLKSIGGIVGSTILTHRLCSQSNVNCKPLHMSTATVDTAAQAGISNPLLVKRSTPLFSELKAEHILPAVEFDLDKLKQDFNDLESIFREPQHGEAWGKRRVEYDYETVIESMEKIQAPLSYSWGAVGHLMGVKNSEELRKAHDALQPRVIEINQQIGQSQLLYHALNALKRQYVWSSLDETQHRIVDSALRSMQASGVGIEDPVIKAQFNKLQLEQAELSTKFSNNVLDSTKLFKLRLTEKEDVDGLPLSSKALAAQQAIASGDTGATADEGPWVFTLDMPSYLPCMQHLRKRDLREQLYRAYVTRASTLEHDNAPIIRRILQIKLDLARMLGYNCFAEKSLSKKMASSVDSVMALNEMLRERAMPAAMEELQQLEQFAQSRSGKVEVKDYSLALWDVPFWSERLREQQYQYQEEELRPYFALPNVLDGLFSLATRYVWWPP